MLQQEENTKNLFHNKYILIKQYQFILHVNGCDAIISFISTAWTRYIVSFSRLTLLKYPVINIYTNIIIMTHLAHKKPTCFIFTNFKKKYKSNIFRMFETELAKASYAEFDYNIQSGILLVSQKEKPQQYESLVCVDRKYTMNVYCCGEGVGYLL